MKKKNIFLLALSIALILAASLNSALAYFTTYVTAQGGYIIELGGTDIEEGPVTDWTKHVTITNDPSGQPVYVRARAFAGDQYELIYSGEGWSAGGDGYCYYEGILYGGQTTPELMIKIMNIPESLVVGDHFNVEVIYESTPVQYDTAGNPYGDWNLTLEGGGKRG